MTPACSNTCRWCASRLDGIASMAASSDGDASPASSVSVIASRAGSASAACTAARRTRSEFRSANIDSILTELPPAQVAGCAAGAVLANLMFALPAVTISAKHRASPAHFLSEVIATLGLLLVIFALARSGQGKDLGAQGLNALAE